MEGYSLYLAIKNQLTPQQQKEIENKIRYNQLMGVQHKHTEDSF